VRGESKIEIGGVARAHGIRGEIVVHTHDPDSDTLGKIETIYVGDVPYKVKQARDTDRGWLVALEGVITRNDAEAMQGKVIHVDRAALELDEDDVLLDDLVGCECRQPDGTVWGKVAAVDMSAFQDMLVVHATNAQGVEVERLLPLVDMFVTNIDLDAGVITVDPPENLPEIPLRKP
jgi:16S rRNA processing protein RimM